MHHYNNDADLLFLLVNVSIIQKVSEYQYDYDSYAPPQCPGFTIRRSVTNVP